MSLGWLLALLYGVMFWVILAASVALLGVVVELYKYQRQRRRSQESQQRLNPDPDGHDPP